MNEANQTWTVQPAVLQPAKKEDTPQTKRMKENFAFFGPVTFLYAVFYAFCMFRNGSGITFPFFIAASLLFLRFTLLKLEITSKRGSAFYAVSMMLLAVSTFCTDDARIIDFNKTGIFLLMMSLLLNQFYNTSGWKLGKYLGAIAELAFVSIGELGRPFSDAKDYMKNRGKKQNRTIWYILLGGVIAVPLLAIVLALLSSADAVFRQVTDLLLKGIRPDYIFDVLFRIAFLFMASYLLISYLCKHTIKEQVEDKRKGEPIVAITITSLLSAVYLLFSGIQIVYLFLRRMSLPQGYTYAEYAREGFFQLLAVSILNLIIVLICMSFFRESKALKIILTIMSFCTFVMIASSALRMMIYISFYYLTFLRVLVLWGLAVLFFLFAGIVASIYSDRFPLFRYSMVVVTVLYIALSFAHPDHMIAAVNVANAHTGNREQSVAERFFQTDEPYQDYVYLSHLSADAAPVLIPYMAELGYDMEAIGKWQTNPEADMWEAKGFGHYYLLRLERRVKDMGLRTFNVSRYRMLKSLERFDNL